MAKKVNLEDAKERDQFWNKRAVDVLKGRTIVAVRYMTDKECENNMWYKRGLLIKLDNGVEIIPGCDDEFNDTGVLHYIGKDGWDCLPSL
jgi:hypothetical protein